jgi:hypothetical protein
MSSADSFESIAFSSLLLLTRFDRARRRTLGDSVQATRAACSARWMTGCSVSD